MANDGVTHSDKTTNTTNNDTDQFKADAYTGKPRGFTQLNDDDIFNSRVYTGFMKISSMFDLV